MTYESDLLYDWYMLFHYGLEDDILRDSAFSADRLPVGALEFPVATVKALRQDEKVARALDLGCAVGRSCFELSRTADEVIGIDYSLKFVEAAKAMQTGEPYPCHIYSEAHLRENITVALPPGCRRECVSFEQGDAMNLRSDIGSFDLVHAANLLCRLHEPTRFLSRLSELVKPGGKLLLATPATWMAEFTPQCHLPTGSTLDYLQEHLSAEFDLQEVTEIPFLIREHRRKFQLSTSQTSLWIRKK
ncbi:MAG: methyltransferase domain-containing protein [Verrucomicrobiales bacterium]|nr:methyltransferase domain-containing protein [Verrucomicrobiales bacterium]